jgi:hypothetical protein
MLFEKNLVDEWDEKKVSKTFVDWSKYPTIDLSEPLPMNDGVVVCKCNSKVVGYIVNSEAAAREVNRLKTQEAKKNGEVSTKRWDQSMEEFIKEPEKRVEEMKIKVSTKENISKNKINNDKVVETIYTPIAKHTVDVRYLDKWLDDNKDEIKIDSRSDEEKAQILKKSVKSINAHRRDMNYSISRDAIIYKLEELDELFRESDDKRVVNFRYVCRHFMEYFRWLLGWDKC